MSLDTAAPLETEAQLIARAQMALSECRWTVGECAARWTQRFARGRTDADFANGGSDRLIDATVAWGDVAAIRKHLDRHLEAGATQVCIHPVGTSGFGTAPDWKILEALAPRG